MFIGISGLIGAGKSTLTKQLAHEMSKRAARREWEANREGRPKTERSELLRQSFERTLDFRVSGVEGPPPLWKAYFEPVETNPYLEDFYRDMARWTFPMQMFLMCARYQQHQELVWDPCHQQGGGVVQDRTIYEDTIFAKMHREDGLMDERDYATYAGHFNVMRRFLQYPDIIVYLHVTPEQAMERIAERGRDAEKTIPVQYMKDLYTGYEAFVKEMSRYTLVLRQDWSEYRPVEEVADKIEDMLSENRDFLKSVRRL